MNAAGCVIQVAFKTADERCLAIAAHPVALMPGPAWNPGPAAVVWRALQVGASSEHGA